jgi:hypothetical protein
VADSFIREGTLVAIKPDLREFGFNSTSPAGNEAHGYEIRGTIPEGFVVPEPLVKKRFEGGLYGALMIPFGAFDEWSLLDY